VTDRFVEVRRDLAQLLICPASGCTEEPAYVHPFTPLIVVSVHGETPSFSSLLVGNDSSTKRAAKPTANHIALVVRGQVQRSFGLQVKAEMVER
jgi:hypothetical protein